jgi:hypothetical protein
MIGSERVAEEQAHLAAFIARLKELGWVEGRNLRLEIRWAADEDESYRRWRLAKGDHAVDRSLYA